MNNLSRDKQIEIISALCVGVGQRAVSRLTGTDRKTVARLALAVGTGCAELHDRMMVGLRVHRIECDELWAYVGHKRNPQAGHRKRHPSPVFGDQYTYVAHGVGVAGHHRLSHRQAQRRNDGRIYPRSARAGYWSAGNFDRWPQSLPLFSPQSVQTLSATHGVINKTYSVTHLNVTEASRRYSPAAVVAVSRQVVSGLPPAGFRPTTSSGEISRVRMASRRFTRLTNGFSKKLDNHAAAVGLYVAHYNLCRWS